MLIDKLIWVVKRQHEEKNQEGKYPPERLIR
jgi:hypothetical protein